MSWPYDLLLSISWPYDLLLSMSWPYDPLLSMSWPYNLLLSMSWPYDLLLSQQPTSVSVLIFAITFSTHFSSLAFVSISSSCCSSSSLISSEHFSGACCSSATFFLSDSTLFSSFFIWPIREDVTLYNHSMFARVRASNSTSEKKTRKETIKKTKYGSESGELSEAVKNRFEMSSLCL